MIFDYKTFVATMLATLKSQLGSDYDSVKEILTSFFTSKEERLKQITEDLAAGEFDADFFKERILDEGDIFLSEVAALKDIGLSRAEGLLNGIAQIFLQTILNLIP